jgi:two-component sensor histidine kinase
MLRRFALPRDEQAPAAARRAIDHVCADLDDAPVDDARLLISELVTNSVRHGVGDTIVVMIDGGMRDGAMRETLRCEVIDDGSGFVPPTRHPDASGGWGLELVGRLSASWGVREGSTHVWFELPAVRRG